MKRYRYRFPPALGFVRSFSFRAFCAIHVGFVFTRIFNITIILLLISLLLVLITYKIKQIILKLRYQKC